MTVRKAEKSDMPSVLNLIRELATFEKEPEAVVISVNLTRLIVVIVVNA